MNRENDQVVFPPLNHSLRRLISQQDAAELLAPFLKMMPGTFFGMLDQDGNIYAGGSEWDPYVLRQAWEEAKFGTAVRTGNFIVRPLIIHRFLAGALLVWLRDDPRGIEKVFPLVEAVGNGFVRLLEQAVEKRELGGELLDRYREINLLYKAAETIGSCLDPEWIPQLVLDQIQPAVSYRMGMVMNLAEEESDHNRPILERLIETAYRGPENFSVLMRRAAEKYLERVVEYGDSQIFIPHPSSDMDVNVEDMLSVMLCVPLKVHERTLGLLLLGRNTGQPEFTAGDEKLVSALAGQAAIALETARLHQEEVKLQRLEEEMSIGRQIQLSFLPESLPEIPGWEFAASYRSARQVGGDLYDLIYSADNPQKLNLVIADVTGKGVAAALFMAFARTVIRLMSIDGGSPGTVLRKANHYILQEQRKAVFMSAFFASLDLSNGILDYANAGHDWPLLLEKKSGKIRALEATGFLLGAFGEVEPDEFKTEIAPGDFLVFYTDGVSEAFNPEHELYGTRRLETLVASNIWASAEELLSHILEDVGNFTKGEQQSDDLTILVVRRSESG